MLVGTNYVTNEVKGSFWRPRDYMSRVPNEHIIGKNPLAADVTLSAEGKALASQDAANRQNKVVFQSEDGTVSRYSFNIHTGEVARVNIAV